MFSVKFIKEKLSVVFDMVLYYAYYKHIHNLDEGFAWNKLNDFCLDKFCFLVSKHFFVVSLFRFKWRN